MPKGEQQFLKLTGLAINNFWDFTIDEALGLNGDWHADIGPCI